MLMLVPLGFFLAWGEQSKMLRLLAFILTGLIFIGCALAFSRRGRKWLFCFLRNLNDLYEIYKN